MSIFSETLSRFLDAKNVQVKRLADYCRLDRSTIYKITKGDRIPASTDHVELMARYMQLSPSETKELLNAWQIVRTGEETWYSRKSVEDFLLRFPSADAQPDLSPALMAEDFPPLKDGCAAFTETQSIDRCIHQMLFLEFQKEAGTVELLLQPDYVFLFGLLATLHPAGTMQVKNIFCLDDKTSIQQRHEVRSLTYLRMIIPLYMNRLDYTPLYFYGSLDAHYNDLNLLPCMVLTSDAALLFSDDRKNGIFIQEPSAVQMLHTQFRGYAEQCTPFLYTGTLDPSTCEGTIATLFATKTRRDIFTIVPEGCLCPFLSKDIIEECINRELPDLDAVRRVIYADILYNRESMEKGWLKVFLTEEGVVHFAERGRIAEIPDIFYHPISVRNRIRMLQRMRVQCEKGTHRILKAPLNHLTDNLHVAVWGEQQLIGSLSFRPSEDSMFFIFMQEEGQLSALRDYLSNLDEDLLYTAEETAGMVDACIRRLQEEEASASTAEP